MASKKCLENPLFTCDFFAKKCYDMVNDVKVYHVENQQPESYPIYANDYRPTISLL